MRKQDETRTKKERKRRLEKTKIGKKRDTRREKNERRKAEKTTKKTYPADCQKIAAVDSHNSIGIEKKIFEILICI